MFIKLCTMRRVGGGKDPRDGEVLGVHVSGLFAQSSLLAVELAGRGEGETKMNRSLFD